MAWREADPDPETRAELDQLLGAGDAVDAAVELAERFEGSLAFGTAGIRAAMGAGPMRMNRLVVGRVAAGLARYIAARDPAAAAPGVVIGYDGRAKSDVFATDAARILSRAGVSVSMLPGPLPTPVLAFSVRHLHAAYGVMVTASHNPRQDNGIKVYVRDGGQLLPPADADIAASIDAVDPLRLPRAGPRGRSTSTPADDAVSAYVAAVAAGRRACGRAPTAAEQLTAGRLKVVHTALHGVGDATLRAVLASAGWPDADTGHRPAAARSRPSRPCPTPTRKRRGCSTWPRRRPSARAPTWYWPTTPTPTGWRSWCRARGLAGAHRRRTRRAARRRGADPAGLAADPAAGSPAGAPRSSPPRWSPARCCAGWPRRPASAASPR